MLRVLNDPSFIHQVVNLKEELEAYEKMEGNIIEIIDDEEFDFISANKEESQETMIEKKEWLYD